MREVIYNARIVLMREVIYNARVVLMREVIYNAKNSAHERGDL